MKKYIENILLRNSVNYITNLFLKKYSTITFDFDFSPTSKYCVYLINKEYLFSNKIKILKDFEVCYTTDFSEFKINKNKKKIYYLTLMSIYEQIVFHR